MWALQAGGASIQKIASEPFISVWEPSEAVRIQSQAYWLYD